MILRFRLAPNLTIDPYGMVPDGASGWQLDDASHHTAAGLAAARPSDGKGRS
jgi:hypothetical protein